MNATIKAVKTMTLQDILTPEEIEKAWQLYLDAKPGTFNRVLVPAVILPIMPRINAKLGQENDPRFIGYAVEYAFNQLFEQNRRKRK